MPQTDSKHATTPWVHDLIRACRDTQLAYEAAAGVLQDRVLRAELLQYSGQRREFIAELISAASKIGGEIVDPGNIREPLARHAEGARQAIGDTNDVAAVLDSCSRSEESAMQAYRFAFSTTMPSVIRAMITTHLAAIQRVRDRLVRLRANSRSERN